MQKKSQKQSYGGKANTPEKTPKKKQSLWGKMWEEYEESVSARRQKRKRKKERRMAKRHEKLRTLSQKRTSFAKTFVCIFLPVLLFTILLCVVGTVIVYQNIRWKVEEKFNGVFNGIQAELFEAYERLYDSKNPAGYDEDWITDTKWRMLMQTPPYEDSFSAVLYDMSDMSEVFDSSEMCQMGIVPDEGKQNTQNDGAVWAGNATMDIYDLWFEKLQADKARWNDIMEADGGSVHLKDGTDECLMFFAKFSAEEESVPDLLLISFWTYNIFEMYGKQAAGIYIGIFLLSVVLSLLLAYRSYFQYLAQSQMNRYRRDMTNAMAHDLKSPLMVISGYAENLRDNVHMEKKDYYAEAILENVQYMNGIIHNILHLAEIEGGEGTLKKTGVDMQKLTEAQLHKYKGCIEDKDIEIVVDLKDAGCLQADGKWMAQLVDNLLSNAVKYTREQGQIFVKATADYFEVRNSLEEPLGVDVTELWKPFVKGDNSRGNEQGSGIGLTIVKNIVKQHGFLLELFEEDAAFVARVSF